MSEKVKVKKPIWKRWWFWVLALFIIGALASGGGEESSQPATTEPAEDTSTETKPEEDKKKEETKKEEKKQVGIGEPIKVGDVVFIVHGMSNAKNVGGEFGKNAQGEFLIVDVSVKNEGKKAITTDASFFKLKSGDVEYEADSEAAIYANSDNNFFLQDVNPGIENKGKVVFDIPPGTKDLKLQVQTGFFGTETGEINLK